MAVTKRPVYSAGMERRVSLWEKGLHHLRKDGQIAKQVVGIDWKNEMVGVRIGNT